MSLGIKSFATEGVDTNSFSEDLVPAFLTHPEVEGI